MLLVYDCHAIKAVLGKVMWQEEVFPWEGPEKGDPWAARYVGLTSSISPSFILSAFIV